MDYGGLLRRIRSSWWLEASVEGLVVGRRGEPLGVERLPEIGVDVLIFVRESGRRVMAGPDHGKMLDDDTVTAVGWRDKYHGEDPADWYWASYDDRTGCPIYQDAERARPGVKVTHWMPLPEPPR